MNIQSCTSKLGVTFLLTISLLSTCRSQSKFFYLSIESNSSTEINYVIDVSGLDSVRQEQIKPYISKTIKIKTENELFNELGKLGWELCFIQDIPNKITQIKNYYNGQGTGDYNIYRDGILSKRKIYFKLRE